MSGIYDDGATYGTDRNDERRERYAAALHAAGGPFTHADAETLADAAMVVADAEQRTLRDTIERLRAELDNANARWSAEVRTSLARHDTIERVRVLCETADAAGVTSGAPFSVAAVRAALNND